MWKLEEVHANQRRLLQLLVSSDAVVTAKAAAYYNIIIILAQTLEHRVRPRTYSKLGSA